MEINFISYVPAIVGLLSIATFVFLNGSNVRNRTFAWFNVSVALWLGFLLAADVSHNLDISIWFLRISLFFGQLMFTAFYFFVLAFPYGKKIRWKREILINLPNVIVAILLLTPLAVGSVGSAEYGARPENLGPLYNFSDLLGVAYMLYGVGLLLSKYKSADLKQKVQLKFVLSGLSIAIVANIITGGLLTFLNVNTQYVDFNGFSLFIFSLFVVYAMFRHGFLDIRLIVARTMGYVLSVATIAILYSGLLFGLLARLLHTDRLNGWTELLYVALAIFLALTFQPLKQFFDKLSNRLFFQDSYDTQAFLGQVNKVLATVYDLSSIMSKSANIIQTNIKSNYCLFIVNERQRIARHDIGTDGSPSLGSELIAIQTLFGSKRGKVLQIENLESKYTEEVKKLQTSGVALVAQLSSGASGGLIGYLVLGPKKSGNLYNSQDVRNIEILANELVIAIQNALHFEEIQNFNLTLQAKVDDATRKLRQTNEKLKTLDDTKDDFISMASHQLRTPLTSIKGYLSMVLEGDAGKVNPTQQKMLGQAYVSSQRMVFLIADLLNVSRLKTGKFVIETAPTNLAHMVGEEIDQLVETAAARQIKLEYDQPKQFPDLMLDETKTRQVIMNFVDNAIYYTPSGGHIRVELSDTPTSVEFKVIDDGIGVPKSEQHHLFTKFYRAGNARNARPDGTGLGLFMAKKVILVQGGSIIFESKEGKGSTFGFLFPKSTAHHIAELPVVAQEVVEPARRK